MWIDSSTMATLNHGNGGDDSPRGKVLDARRVCRRLALSWWCHGGSLDSFKICPRC